VCLLGPALGRGASVETGIVQLRLAAPGAPGAAPVVARLRALDFVWSAEVAERAGHAVFVAVPPGRHELVVERAGVAATRAVLVQPGVTTALIATLEPAGPSLQESAVDQPAEGTAFGADWLRDLPTSRDPWSVLETAEPVAIADRMDTGGVWAGRPGRFTAHGTSLTQAGVRFGGVETSDPLGGGPPLFDPDLAWVSSLGFATALLPASVAGAGPVLAAVPRRPGHSWSGDLTADVADPGGLNDPTAAVPIARLESWWSGTAVAGGPLSDRLGLLLAGSLRDAARVEREQPTELPSRVGSAMGLLVFTPSASQELRLLGAVQGTDRPFEGRAADLEPGREEEAGALLVGADWAGRRRDGATALVRLGYSHGTLDNPDATLSGTVERLRDGPVPDLPLPGRRVLSRLSASGQVDLPGRLFGAGGALQGGVSSTRAVATSTPVPGVWRTPERLDGVGARVWETTVGRTRQQWTSTDVAGWVEGRTDPARRLVLQAGARVEWLGASAETGATDVSWLTVSPRLRARWRLGSQHALVAGLGQYRHALPLAPLAFGDAAAPTAEVYRWDDRNGDGVFLLPERGPLVARYGPGAPVATLDDGLRAPRTWEVLLGIERRHGPWVARFVGTYRRERDLLETVNVGVTADDYVMRTVPDPGGDILGSGDDQLLPVFDRRPQSFGDDRYLLTNVSGDDAWHEGAEITLMRDGERFGFLLGATAHRSDGPNAWRGFRPSENDQGFVGERRDQPNADTFGRGRLFSDRAYTIKIASRYAAPGDLRLGVVARYQDGQPFARLVIDRDLAQGAEAVQAVPNGRHRFEFAITLDARVEKGFRLGRARLAAVAEAFNLLGNAHEVEEYVVTGAAFRTPTASQPPRVFRFGVRLDLR
jgi:hypothetical protein